MPSSRRTFLSMGAAAAAGAGLAAIGHTAPSGPLGIGGAPHASAFDTAPMEEAVQSVLNRYVGDTVVGAHVLVAHRGRIATSQVAGYRDRRRELAVMPNTAFRLASVTKPYIALAALSLIDRGVLALDARVEDWLPWFRPEAPDGSRGGITIRHLLAHTSGLDYGFQQSPPGRYRAAGISDGLDRTSIDLTENIRRLASMPLLFNPGQGWRYSLSYDVLGLVMESALQRPLPEIVDMTVLRPLRLHASSFHVNSAADRDLAVAYADGAGGPEVIRSGHALAFGQGVISFDPVRAFDPTAFPSGGAGMIGTAADVLTVLEAVRTQQLLSPELSNAMMSDQTAGHAADLLGYGAGYGFGGAIASDGGEDPLRRGAWRWGGVYGHHWFVDRERELTLVCLTNTATAGMAGPFPDDLACAVYDAAQALEEA